MRYGLLLLALFAVVAWGQTSDVGSVTVNVTDASGATVPDAQLQLRNLETNDMRRAATQANGNYAFPNLPFGVYELTVSKAGFDSQVFQSVQVQVSRITTINVALKVGGTTQTVTVADAATPLVETDSSTLSDSIDTKQVVNLPVSGRNIMSLAFLVPGWSSTQGVGSTFGTWDNLPGGAVVSADFDGTPGISNRFRSGGFQYGTTAVQPRIEDVAEMTIQTAQLDLGGIGTSAMRISIVQRHGTNAFHGRVYEDFRNTDLNANSWINNATNQPRNILKLNDFGASVGGPVLKNKLFFFGTFAESIQPFSGTVTSTVLSPGAQQGLFSYKDPSGAIQTLNLLNVAGAAGLPSTLNSNVAASLAAINGTYGKGSLIPTSDPNIFKLAFPYTHRDTIYYPTVRMDWNATDKVRMFVSYAQTKTFNDLANNPQFPGNLPQDKLNYTSNRHNNRIAGVGVDWLYRPTLVNQFHAGYMYQFDLFDAETLGIDLPNLYRQNWPYGLTSLYGNAYPRRPISSFYPLLNAVDNLTWQKGAHSIVFGASWFREQDHYWNGPGGEPNYTFALDAQDPATNAINGALASQNTTIQGNARSLYSLLAARVSRVSIGVGRPLDPSTGQYKPFGSYNLDEVQAASGFWTQDRWRLRPNLTLNYGLRWDIYGDNHDVNGFYSSPPSIADLWGPTPVGVVDSPGTLGGVANPTFQARVHVYNTQWKNFSPAIALAWSPSRTDGWMGKLVGKDKTVIRTGYSLRSYLEGAQNFWAFASNSGQFFFQSGSITPNTGGGTGTFQPGALTFGSTLPGYLLQPSTYSKTVPAANLWGSTFWGMNPNIRMPYVQQWNFGIQRQIGAGSAIEVRYVGNLSLHQWLSYDINEVNVFENGFLKEFQNAQSNLKINQANGKGNSFANNGFAGQVALPIFTGAFGSATSSNFSNSTFVNNLLNGGAGSMAQTLATNKTFYCNLVGTNNWAPCVAQGITASAAGAGFPVNFWQTNPYASGVNYLDAAGHTNYHALQIDFRQRPTHGMQFNVNYSWAHSLGIAAQDGIQGQGNNIYYTQRNFRLNYGPSLFDIRHVVHASGTYDLPFGKGRQYLNQSRLADYTVGGWTLGTIVVIQSGNPFQFGNGFGTLNNGDSGVSLNGVTVGNLQNAIGVFRTGNPWVDMIDPKFIGANGAANAALLSPNNVAGSFGYRPYVYGPGWYNIDLSVNKTFPIRESVRFTFQAEFLNATNHPTFNFITNPNTLSVQSNSFGQSNNGNAFSGARRIEFRANLEF
ncbi:MAG TPA: carboxypeptidase-like regulatory domain-containing protein [Bryobacteraceae bacterium]|nr:carboxypeptidase-like regulatory domain-containing protein [Bryobacteraceae bacterium]